MPSLRLLFALLLAVAVSGCGFQLRGTASASLPYKTLYVALPETAEVRVWLERYINATGRTELVGEAKDAEAVFQQVQDNRQKGVLSVNAQGRVREYRLQMIYTFRIVNQKGQILVPDNEISLTRDITFNDSDVLAKNQEEGLLWRDMNNDLVNQIMRRLSIVKPLDPNRPEED